MNSQETLNKIKEQYDKAKALAKEIWDDGDHEGDANEKYYFETGFIAGLACGLKQNLENIK
jgi:hypothetical protein